MAELKIYNLNKVYRLHEQQVRALENISLEVSLGSFVTIIGRSGCGKTTLLRVISGLEMQSSGQIIYPDNAKIGMVFQEPRLMPWLTVKQNLALVMKGSKHEIVDEIDAQLEMLGLSSFKDAYPAQISGGMAQRVALGRALGCHSNIILMDEPLSALDAFTRQKIQEELIHIFLTHKITILFVTHDIDEALIMGQRVIVMDQGHIFADLAVPLPYPRDTIKDERFYRLRQQLLTLISKRTRCN